MSPGANHASTRRDVSKTEYDQKPLPFSAVQGEQIRKAYQGLTAPVLGPGVSKLMPALKDFKPAFDIGAMAKAITPRYDFGIDLAKSLEQNIPKFKLELAPLQLDYARLFGPALNFESLGLRNIIDTPSTKLFDEIYGSQRDRFEGIFKNFREAFDRMLPPNWRGVQGLDKIETLLLDEGLALAWVPPTDILAAVLNASSKQERRRIIGKRWKRIVAGCRESLESVSSDDVSGYRTFALKVVELLEAGQPEGAQALAASLLDTMLRETLDGKSRREVTFQGKRLSIDDLPWRAAMVFGGIWGSHTEFWQSKGDSIPRQFTRHASAHGVSTLQYSRINAVVAAMHCTAYIMLLDSGDLD